MRNEIQFAFQGVAYTVSIPATESAVADSVQQGQIVDCNNIPPVANGQPDPIIVQLCEGKQLPLAQETLVNAQPGVTPQNGQSEYSSPTASVQSRPMTDAEKAVGELGGFLLMVIVFAGGIKLIVHVLSQPPKK